MVMTHKEVKKQKKMKIHVKEDNPARKSMTQAQAIADNKRLKEQREKVEKYAQSLKNEGVAREVVKEGDPLVAETVNVQKIEELKIKLNKQRGPGSKVRRAKIQEEIDELQKRG